MENADFLALSFGLYERVRFFSRCLQLPKTSRCLQPSCLCNARARPDLAYQRFPPSPHAPRGAKGTTAEQNICRSFHLLVPAEKICSRKNKGVLVLTPACLWHFSVWIFWCPSGIPLPANCFFRQIFLGILSPPGPCQDALEKGSKVAVQVEADWSWNVLFLVLPFLGAFCGSKGHWNSQESQLKVPFQLLRAPFLFITRPAAFLGLVFELRPSTWDVMKTHCSSLHKFLPAPLGQLPASCWGSPLLPEALSLPCHLLHLIRDLSKSLGSS